MGVKLLDGRKDSFNEKDTLFDDQTDRFIQVAEGVNFSIIDILFLDYPSVLQSYRIVSPKHFNRLSSY